MNCLPSVLVTLSTLFLGSMTPLRRAGYPWKVVGRPYHEAFVIDPVIHLPRSTSSLPCFPLMLRCGFLLPIPLCMGLCSSSSGSSLSKAGWRDLARADPIPPRQDKPGCSGINLGLRTMFPTQNVAPSEDRYQIRSLWRQRSFTVRMLPRGRIGQQGSNSTVPCPALHPLEVRAVVICKRRRLFGLLQTCQLLQSTSDSSSTHPAAGTAQVWSLSCGCQIAIAPPRGRNDDLHQ